MDQWNRASIHHWSKKEKNSWLQVRKNTFACQPHIYTRVFSLKKNAGQFLSTSICLMRVECASWKSFWGKRLWGCITLLGKWSPCCTECECQIVWTHVIPVYLEKQSTFEMAQLKLNPHVLSDAFWGSLTLLSCSCIYLPRIVPLSSLVSKV